VPPSKPGRLPGDPADADRDFGPLGGLADDVFFWQKSRERATEVEADRLSVSSTGRFGPIARLWSQLRHLRRRDP
jgi:hypothetical protein